MRNQAAATLPKEAYTTRTKAIAQLESQGARFGKRASVETAANGDLLLRLSGWTIARFAKASAGYLEMMA